MGLTSWWMKFKLSQYNLYPRHEAMVPTTRHIVINLDMLSRIFICSISTSENQIRCSCLCKIRLARWYFNKCHTILSCEDFIGGSSLRIMVYLPLASQWSQFNHQIIDWLRTDARQFLHFKFTPLKILNEHVHCVADIEKPQTKSWSVTFLWKASYIKPLFIIILCCIPTGWPCLSKTDYSI